MIDPIPLPQTNTASDLGTLMVPVGSDSPSTHLSEDAALRTAAWLARQGGSRVVLVRVAAVPEDWSLWEPEDARAAATSRHADERRLDRLIAAAQRLYYAGLSVEVEVIRRVDVPVGIAEAAAEVEADLVVMGAPCLGRHEVPSFSCKVAQVVERSERGVLAVYRAESPRAPTALQHLVLVRPEPAATSLVGDLVGALAAQQRASVDVVTIRETASRPLEAEPRAEGGTARIVVDDLDVALEVASGRGADLVLVDGGYGFEALVQAGVVTHAQRGGDWVFAFPRRSSSERAGR
ncbi:MAG: universal stress protein [Bacteroidota bacterium]